MSDIELVQDLQKQIMLYEGTGNGGAKACELYRRSVAEIARLRKLIEEVECDDSCASMMSIGAKCSCWVEPWQAKAFGDGK